MPEAVPKRGRVHCCQALAITKEILLVVRKKEFNDDLHLEFTQGPPARIAEPEAAEAHS